VKLIGLIGPYRSTKAMMKLGAKETSNMKIEGLESGSRVVAPSAGLARIDRVETAGIAIPVPRCMLVSAALASLEADFAADRDGKACGGGGGSVS